MGLIIVSDMLLTGWDAPIVSTMYLDKPLKEHTLLQAIARVNRTQPGKNAGYIVDYHGVVEHLDQALKLYGGEVQPAQVWQGMETELPKLQSTLERVLKLLPKQHDPVSEREAYKDDAERFWTRPAGWMRWRTSWLWPSSSTAASTSSCPMCGDCPSSPISRCSPKSG